MKPVAVVSHPPFGALGGGEVVAAWTVQALADDFDVVVVCRDEVDFERTDERFGTRLHLAPPRVVTWSAWMRLVHAAWPWSGERWMHLFQERMLMRVARRGAVAAWISTFNESRLPGAGLQYVHFPVPGAAVGAPGKIYEKLIRLLSRRDLAGPEKHRTLVNSRFTETVWRGMHAEAAEVVYPPAPPLCAGKPWAERAEFRMVCLGRLMAGKGIATIARIVAGVRAQGVPMTLALVGPWCCGGRERGAIETGLRGFDWIEWHGALSRSRLAGLVADSRYGLHGMKREPFGIAVAELQAAGCVVFAPEEGGPAEILEEPAQLYRDEEDAVWKILAVARSPERQAELHARAQGRAESFSTGRFMAEIRGRLPRAGGGGA